MPTYDLSALRRPKGGGSGAGILLDQLQIAENMLAKDGYLSEGDYDTLINMAKTLQLSPGLTPDQRSSYNVKLSEYSKNKNLVTQKNTSDIDRMNAAIKSESREDVMVSGNNPAEFLKGRAASLTAKIADLTETIDSRDQSGQDSSQYSMELNDTLRQYSDVINAQEAAKGFNPNDPSPIPGYAAYAVTNNKGEIVDIDYAPYGSKSGYVETSGMINGFQVYGKVNQKVNGRNVFKLGDQTFSGVDSMLPDPENPGSFKAFRLVNESQQSGNQYVKFGKNGYTNIDPRGVQIQSYIPRGTWAKGVNGTYYLRGEDGNYTKYLNFTPPVPDDQILEIPKSLENKILAYSKQTVDGSAASAPAGFIGPVNSLTPLAPTAASTTDSLLPVQSAPSNPAEPFNSTPPAFNLQGNQPGTAVPAVPSVKQTSQPISRSPQSTGGYATQTLKKGVDFVKNLFS